MDADGDGVREFHGNAMEGLWTGLRNFLRPFRGVSKEYLYQYVALFEWGCNAKRLPNVVRRRLAAVRRTTSATAD